MSKYTKIINKLENPLKKVEDDPLSDTIIRKYLKDPKIILYEDLKNYNDINELLPNNKDYVVILFKQDDKGNNHWIGLLKYDNIIEHFCSYGSYPDEYYFEWTTQSDLNKAKEYKPYMSELLNKCGYEIVYSSKDYQKDKGQIATCGRHITNRIMHLINHDNNINDYYHYMKKIKNKSGLDYDQIVSAIINDLD